MCGIAGILYYEERERPVERFLLQKMTRSLAHRGPDGEGLWSAPGIGLGHRRLAILDLSEQAAQPMHDTSLEITITFNGEIYNFRELRSELEGLGHRFRSSGDTEVILEGYREWGTDVLSRISGIFAFAIWDASNDTLFLARDPLGVKPLFFSDAGGTFRFGSEIKAILSDPAVSRDHDQQALDAFFTFSYTVAPATGFQSVRQLLPGHALKVTRNGLSTWQYWKLHYTDQPINIDFPTALEEFGHRLTKVTRAQMVSDVPLAAFLSGGLDSAAIVRAMKEADSGPVRAVTVGFDVPGFDERDRTRATAQALDVELSERALSIDAAGLLPHLSQHLEEPTADSSSLAVYLLCEAAAEQFTVAMSGDGADEMLAGYDTYRATLLARQYRRIPGWIRRGAVQPLARLIPVTDRKYGWHQVVNRFVYGAELGPGLDHCAWRIILSRALKDRLYNSRFARQALDNEPLTDYRHFIDSVPASRAPLNGLLNADLAFYLPNDMLIKVDRMSMAHGLEVRVPFLDADLVQFCANLPAEFKLHRGRIRKHILRESMRPYLPATVLEAPKSGFNIPIDTWMAGPLRALLFDSIGKVSDDFSRFFTLAAVEKLANEHSSRKALHGHALFTLLMFALWLDNSASAWR